MRLFFVLIAAFFVATLIFTTEGVESLLPASRLKCTKSTCSLSDTDVLRFFIIGDIGGLPLYPYVSYAQTHVAQAMARVATKVPVHFVVNVGDNFYFSGVSDVHSSRFESAFEEVYGASSLNIPWYTIAGNHDHLGNISAQIEYTNYSNKWTFPHLFYKVQYAFTNTNGVTTNVEILMLDTIILCGNTVDVEDESIFSWLFAKKMVPDHPPPEYEGLAKIQWEWIEETLKTSTADYLFVFGHYPIYSASEHGTFTCLEDRLDPLLRKYNVNAYISGHDHNLQHIQIIQSTASNNASAMDYIVCGSGSRTDRSGKHVNDFKPDQVKFRYPTGWNPFSQLGFTAGGFIVAEVQSTNAIFKFVTNHQEIKHKLTLIPRPEN